MSNLQIESDVWEDYLQEKAKIEGTIFHYTNQEALLSILEKHELWASDILYLNDSEEFRLAKNLALQTIEEHNLNIPRNDILTRFLNLLEVWSDVSYQVFVISFSSKPDVLSQWRAYGGSTTGYSIGFDLDRLRQMKWSNSEESIIAPCIYKTSQQQTILKDLLKSTYESLRLLEDPALDLSPSDIAISFWSMFVRIAPFIKHKGFEEEQEWRLVIVLPRMIHTEIHIRNRDSLAIPYIKAEFTRGSDCPIKDIVIGPSLHQDLNARTIAQNIIEQQFVNEYEIASSSSGEIIENAQEGIIKIQMSRIPYRNW